MSTRIHQVNKHGRLIIEGKDNAKNQVPKKLKEFRVRADNIEKLYALNIEAENKEEAIKKYGEAWTSGGVTVKESELENFVVVQINTKEEVLKKLKETCEFQNEKEFIERMKSYNAYDDENIIKDIFAVVSDEVTYEYISQEGFPSYGQVSYYSKTIMKTVLLTQDDDFHNYNTLCEIIEAIKSYETEVAQVEYNMKHRKG